MKPQAEIHQKQDGYQSGPAENRLEHAFSTLFQQHQTAAFQWIPFFLHARLLSTYIIIYIVITAGLITQVMTSPFYDTVFSSKNQGDRGIHLFRNC